MQKVKRGMIKSMYMVIVLGDKLPGDDLGDCLKFSCENKKILGEYTGISYDRLVYLFTRLRKEYLIEDGNLIIRSESHHRGRQLGGLKGKNRLRGFNR